MTPSSFRLKLKASYIVSEVLWSLLQEKLDSQTIYNLNFRRSHHCHYKPRMNLQNYYTTKVCNLTFQNIVYVIFWWKQEMNTLIICTAYLCDAALQFPKIDNYKSKNW